MGFGSRLPYVKVRVRERKTLAIPPPKARSPILSRARAPRVEGTLGQLYASRCGARGGRPWKHAQGTRHGRGAVVSAAVARLLAVFTRQKVEEDPRLNAKVVSQ